MVDPLMEETTGTADPRIVGSDESGAGHPASRSQRISVAQVLAESERETDRYSWEGTFAQYLEMVIATPALSRLSHGLVYDAIGSAGTEEDLNGEPVYRLFDGQIFGLESALDRIVGYFEASARRLEVRKRILLLLGPPASGKSSIIDIIKRGLEDYTKTQDGAVYTIQGCPMQEDPLHLIPGGLRARLARDHGLHIEGDLCFHCRFLLERDYRGNPAEVPVTRIVFSESQARGYRLLRCQQPKAARPVSSGGQL